MDEIFNSVIEADECAVVICNPLHKIIYMNEAADKRYARYGGRKLVGSSILSCHNKDSAEKIIRVVEWFLKSEKNNKVFTGHNEKENKDVYMVALRNKAGELIAYYEKHEYRDVEKAEPYFMPD